MKLNFSFSLRGPDRVAEELATVLSKSGAMEFKSLFDVVHANLRSRDLARGGEEMLRLRAYEKLQNFVQAGIVKKTGKEYIGVRKALAAFFKTAAEFNARFASGAHCRPPLKAAVIPGKSLSELGSAVAKTAVSAPVRKVTKAGKAKVAVRKSRMTAGKKALKGRKAMAHTR